MSADTPIIPTTDALKDEIMTARSRVDPGRIGNPPVMIRDLTRSEEFDVCSVIVQGGVLYIEYERG